MMILSSTGERVAAAYVALFFGYGIYLPFYPLLLADRGMGDTEIALLIAIPMALRAVLASPLSFLADRVGNRSRVLLLYSFGAAFSFSWLFLAHSFFPILIVSILTSLFSTATVPVADALATSVVRQGGGDYGRIRMWGSMSFVVASVVGGALVAIFSAHSLYWVLLVALWGGTIVLRLVLPSNNGMVSASSAIIDPNSVDARTIRPHFLQDRVLIAGMVGAALIQASHAMVYSFSSLYWGSIGFSGTEVGIFWAAGVVSEIMMFFLSGRLLGRWGPGQMLVLSGSAAITRWLLFPVLASFSGYLVLQSLHALTFACCHLAIMRLIVTRVADRSAATVQGLYATVGALTMAGATLVAGPLYRNFGEHGFQLMSVFVIAGLVPVLIWVGLDRQSTFETP